MSFVKALEPLFRLRQVKNKKKVHDKVAESLKQVPITQKTLENYLNWKNKYLNDVFRIEMKTLKLHEKLPQDYYRKLNLFRFVNDIIKRRVYNHERRNKTAGVLPGNLLNRFFESFFEKTFAVSEKSTLRPNRSGKRKANEMQSQKQAVIDAFESTAKNRYNKGQIKDPTEATMVVERYKTEPRNNNPPRRIATLQKQTINRLKQYMSSYIKGDRKAVTYGAIDIARVVVFFRPELLQKYLTAKFIRSTNNKSYKYDGSTAEKITDLLKPFPTTTDMIQMKSGVNSSLKKIEKIEKNAEYNCRFDWQDFFLPGISFMSGQGNFTGTCMNTAIKNHVIDDGRPHRVKHRSHFQTDYLKLSPPSKRKRDFIFLIFMSLYRHYNNPKSPKGLKDMLYNILENLLKQLTPKEAEILRVDLLTRFDPSERRSERLFN